MREKNIKTRQDIMRAAYGCFSQKPYKEVFLKDISDSAGIKKTLLQYYYPQKHILLSDMMGELLGHSFHYVDEIIDQGTKERAARESGDANIHIKLAVYTAIIWMSCDIDEAFGRFLTNAYQTQEVVDYVMDKTYEWLKGLLQERKVIVDLHTLRYALEFSVTGGMHIYFKRDKFEMTPQKIMEEISITFMRMMGCRSEDRFLNIRATEKIVEGIDLGQFLDYCEDSIDWYIRHN